MSFIKDNHPCCLIFRNCNPHFCCSCSSETFNKPCCYDIWTVRKPPGGGDYFKYRTYNTCWEFWISVFCPACTLYSGLMHPGRRHQLMEFPPESSNIERLGSIATAIYHCQTTHGRPAIMDFWYLFDNPHMNYFLHFQLLILIKINTTKEKCRFFTKFVLISSFFFW